MSISVFSRFRINMGCWCAMCSVNKDLGHTDIYTFHIVTLEEGEDKKARIYFKTEQVRN